MQAAGEVMNDYKKIRLRNYELRLRPAHTLARHMEIRSRSESRSSSVAHIVRDWRTDLIEAHPDLFHPLPDDPGVAQASPECGEGWQDLLERACARIRAAVQADGGTLQLTQSKEKSGPASLYCVGGLSPKAEPRADDM